jgi:hypothetical protein
MKRKEIPFIFTVGFISLLLSQALGADLAATATPYKVLNFPVPNS